jgi:CRP-like cAMP-binding protein
MARDDKVEALRSVRLFERCSERDLRAVARLCTRIDVEEGFVLTAQGGPGDECFVIASGEAEVRVDGRVVAKAGPGECVGEQAVLDRGRRTATVTARTPMTIYAVTGEEFRSLLDANGVASRMLTALAGRLHSARQLT